jgi:hypothetical protein
MTMTQSRRHDESSALGTNSIENPTWVESTSNDDDYLPVDNQRLPIIVYPSTDFRPGPMDNGQISLKATLQAAAAAGMHVVRWTSSGSGNHLDGVAEVVNPFDDHADTKTVDIESIRDWPGGITILASWPNNEQILRALEVLLTGPYGEPRIVRDAGNARVHMHDQIAGYGNGINYAARRRR